jgi:hypothetical protein
MQQQVQTALSAAQVLSEASSFFTKRRARVTDKTDRGFKFALPGAEDGGSLSISPAGAGGTTVTIEVEGLGVQAIAEGYVRELRKHSKSQARAGGGSNVPLSDLRQRLGMPEPRPRQRPPAEAPSTTEQGAGSEAGGARPDGPTPAEAVTAGPEGEPAGGPAPVIESGDADHGSTAEVSGGVPAAEDVSTSGVPRRADA